MLARLMALFKSCAALGHLNAPVGRERRARSDAPYQVGSKWNVLVVYVAAAADGRCPPFVSAFQALEGMDDG